MENNLTESIVKKKRGRKPKNLCIDENIINLEKKKRGRKKKYEIENFDKIVNRNNLNNFNHSIEYSDNEEENSLDQNIKKVSFGNLNITVSKKKIDIQENNLVFKTNLNKINLDENLSDEEIEVDISTFIDKLIQPKETFKETEKQIFGNKKYIPDFATKDQSVNNLRVIPCLKNVIKENNFPEKTDIHCWWCCHKFDGCPCALPISYDTRLSKFSLTGIFCSWSCVKAYNFEINDYKKYIRSSLIALLVKKVHNIYEAVLIKAAPPRQCLKIFGGYMDIVEFRNNSLGVDKYNLNLIKYNYIYPVTEITNIKYKNENKNLRLSRNKS